jgi:hypothetical protein
MKRTVEDVFGTVPDINNLPNGLDADAKERIKKHAERLTEEDSDVKNVDKTSNIVTKELCELMHDMDSKDIPHTDIIDCMPFSSQHTLYYHLREDCDHSYRSKLSYHECGWMRIYAKQGAPLQTLTVLFNISERNASIHLSGECNHEDMLEPVSTEQLRANSVETAPIVTSICPICDQEFTHKEYRDRTTCSEQCRNIYASEKSHKTL